MFPDLDQHSDPPVANNQIWDELDGFTRPFRCASIGELIYLTGFIPDHWTDAHENVLW